MKNLANLKLNLNFKYFDLTKHELNVSRIVKHSDIKAAEEIYLLVKIFYIESI